MVKSIEATMETNGRIRLTEPIRLLRPCRVIVTIIDDLEIPETAILSEQALAEDWNRPEEDAAWSHLQRAR